MAESLRDQLLKSGIVKKIQPEQIREPRRSSSASSGKPGRAGGKLHAPPAKQSSQQDIDLAKAYALRTQAEARERKQIEREAAEQARLRRERKLRLQQLLEGKALNKADVDQVRNFEYAGKIRRIHVDATQLAALNAGELGVVQHAGRYLLVTREVAGQVGEIEPRQLALLVEPGTASADDDGVPDDLMW
ncbi:MAG: DUF2058 family protein [Rhodanobacter sp.]|nr:MAG: DUF2058 family protein [Rhodanobacter sp.]TAL95637.1 MAG: DUF2058 family protein [Rhodanobacter sp.]TAM39131.1 MAG: DUF2058 family protein [Rhodanobacter sp.]